MHKHKAPNKGQYQLLVISRAILIVRVILALKKFLVRFPTMHDDWRSSSLEVWC